MPNMQTASRISQTTGIKIYIYFQCKNLLSPMLLLMFISALVRCAFRFGTASITLCSGWHPWFGQIVVRCWGANACFHSRTLYTFFELQILLNISQGARQFFTCTHALLAVMIACSWTPLDCHHINLFNNVECKQFKANEFSFFYFNFRTLSVIVDAKKNIWLFAHFRA